MTQTSLARMLTILDLFTEARPSIAADEIVASLGYSRPTGYRYLRELCDAGLLVRSAAGYSLGPRIIELDWQIRRCDPVLQASRAIMLDLVVRTGADISLVGIYGDRIVTLYHERGTEKMEINFGRGRPMPLFRGAPSKAILAFLPRARLRRIHDDHRNELAPAQRRAGWTRLLQEMLEIRSAGHAVSHGELDADKVGIAAPVFNEGRVSGSLCLILTAPRYATSDRELLARMVMEAAEKISQATAAGEPPQDGRREAAD